MFFEVAKLRRLKKKCFDICQKVNFYSQKVEQKARLYCYLILNFYFNFCKTIEEKP